jgi:predicted amino acid racemase
MNRIVIDAAVLRRNIQRISQIMRDAGADWTLVTKLACGHVETLRELAAIDVKTIGDTRLENLQVVTDEFDAVERWYLRPPHMSAAQRIVDLTDVSLDTEMDALEALDAAARRRDKKHRVVVMVEIGELREGVLPSSLISFFRRAGQFPNLDVIGLGANVGCLSGTIPTIEQLSPLPLYQKLLEHEFGFPLPLVSAGSSVVLAALLRGNVPDGINHYRIGEAVFLGTDLIHGGLLPDFENAMAIDAEIIEIKEKNLVPLGEISGDLAPFESVGRSDGFPGERGHRALVSIGQLDTEVSGLDPVDPEHSIVGASSDISVVNLGTNPGRLCVGDTIRFRPSYSAVARAMSSRYLRRELIHATPRDDQTFASDATPDPIAVKAG